MTNKHPKNKTKKKYGSLIWNAITFVTSYIYTLFENCIVKAVGYKLFNKSTTSRVLQGKAKGTRIALSRYVDIVFEKSRALSAIQNLKSVLASLSFNVYGIFFAVYGLTASFMYYISISMNGEDKNGTSAIIIPFIIFVCSIPMLLTNRSVAAVVADSKIVKRIVINIFSIPEEKLRSYKTYGGTEYSFMLSLLALLLGIFTYFIHPAYVPAIFGIVVLISIISSNPETGVLLSVAIAPFLQYTEHSKLILGIMIAVTMLAYVGKLIRRKRTVSLSSESVFVLIFCGFLIVGSIASIAGAVALKEAFYNTVIVIGGFFLTYNLLKGEDRLRICSKILFVSTMSIFFFGIWNVFYNAIIEKRFYSLHESVSPIFENNTIYIADTVSVFSVMVALTFPLLLSGFVKQKTAKGMSCLLVLFAASVFSIFVYGSYEAVIVIFIEFFVFWLLYSHKSLSVVIIAAIPFTTCLIAYPLIAKSLGLPAISEIIRAALPIASPDEATRMEVIRCSIDMLTDGNLGGIGAGTRAFEIAFGEYSNVISDGAIYPGSFWIQIICWSGIGGTVCFVITVTSLIVKGISTLFTTEKKLIRGDLLALICGLIGALLLGIVNCIWLDERMLYLFWVCVALLAGYIRDSEDVDTRRSHSFPDECDTKEIEIKFNKNY